MNIWEAIALGVVQGLTEFLPISSSGHLVLFQHLFGFREPMIAFDIVLHCGTLMAILIYFFHDIVAILRDLAGSLLARREEKNGSDRPYPEARLVGPILWVTALTGAAGYFFHDAFELVFSSILSVGLAWIVMGLLLIASRFLANGPRVLERIRFRDATWIGLAQCVSMIPGISRSGSTILAGMATGLERSGAARFSFLIAIPAILGAAVFELKDGLGPLDAAPLVWGAGFLASLAVGYVSIALLLKMVFKGRFYLFGIYCLAAGLLTLLYANLGQAS